MEKDVTVRTFTQSTKKDKADNPMTVGRASIFQRVTGCFFIDRALPTVDLQVSEGKRAPSQGTPAGGSSAKKSLILFCPGNPLDDFN